MAICKLRVQIANFGARVLGSEARMRYEPCTRLGFVLVLAACQGEDLNALETAPSSGDGSACLGAGWALAFDGVDDRVVADLGGSLPTGNTARTAEMWIYTRATSWAFDQRTIFEYGVNTLHQAFAIDMQPFP